MNTFIFPIIAFTFLVVSNLAFAAKSKVSTSVLADVSLLRELNLAVLQFNPDLHVGYAKVGDQDLLRLSQLAHKKGRCGGYQVIEENSGVNALKKFDQAIAREKKYSDRRKVLTGNATYTSFNPRVRDAIGEVSDVQVGEWISWLSNFGGRFHASAEPNRHTEALAERLRAMTANVGFPVRVDLIAHRRTQQKSVRLHLEGSERPREIIVLGGHLDSVNWGMFGDKNNAPGSDDNASGSASLLEALRVLLKQGQPQRSVEFMWYAAEEVGLYGSTEISQQYRNEQKDVIAVLQLDMTLHPGSGETTISSITDFTSGWLRDLLVEFNRDYLNMNIINDKCGYACSDHAPWFQQNYPTLMPFEAHTNDMNNKIHTPNDRINPASSFKHAAIFSKIAVIYTMVLANSELRQP